ncbi:hypothetical protein ALP31_200159 [Pseudomonas amygdali pv. morsprunorum]|nr:hypothetical protein ALP31_200159 [Pseudomonas amygdali pv. morsprunorum]
MSSCLRCCGYQSGILLFTRPHTWRGFGVLFLLVVQDSGYPAFRAVTFITAFGNENVICFIHSVYAWALIARITQGILPAVHRALPDQHDAATVILVSISPFSGSCTKRFTKIGHG